MSQGVDIETDILVHRLQKRNDKLKTLGDAFTSQIYQALNGYQVAVDKEFYSQQQDEHPTPESMNAVIEAIDNVRDIDDRMSQAQTKANQLKRDLWLAIREYDKARPLPHAYTADDAWIDVLRSMPS